MLRIPLMLLCFSLAGCATRPPAQTDDICAIFSEKPRWHRAALKTQSDWGVPVGQSMAFIFQESSFQHNAKAPRKHVFFGIVPWGRTSSAYGYSQALNQTWRGYVDATGNWGADRDNFDDAMDFIGWYSQQTRARNGVAMNDSRRQYLNYHEGWGGFSRKSYEAKTWLLNVAKRVEQRSADYERQYKRCQEHLRPGFWRRLFS